MNQELRKIVRLMILMAVMMLASTWIYYFLARLEGHEFSWLRCLYMVTITITTIGYEDLLNVKDSVSMTIFTIVTILTYMIVVAYTVSHFTAFLVEGRLRKYFELRKLRQRIAKMNQHVIICGIKDIGAFVAHELFETKRPFVVIDTDENTLQGLAGQIEGMVYVHGDATEDGVLEQANIKEASGLIAALENDKDNLYLTLAARELNGGLTVAAKYNAPSAMAKLRKAGAAHLVCPSRIGGLRIASELIRPQVVSFLEMMMRSKSEAGVRVEQVVVGEQSGMIGRTLGEVHEESGVLIISYQRKAGDEYCYNPQQSDTVSGGMTLFFIADPAKRDRLAKLMA